MEEAQHSNDQPSIPCQCSFMWPGSYITASVHSCTHNSQFGSRTHMKGRGYPLQVATMSRASLKMAETLHTAPAGHMIHLSRGGSWCNNNVYTRKLCTLIADLFYVLAVSTDCK